MKKHIERPEDINDDDLIVPIELEQDTVDKARAIGALNEDGSEFNEKGHRIRLIDSKGNETKPNKITGGYVIGLTEYEDKNSEKD